MIPKKTRKPTHPGIILREMYLEPLDLTITKAAEELKLSRKTLSAICNARKSITPDTALRLSIAFDTTPEFWLNLQQKYNIWEAANHPGDWHNVKKLIPENTGTLLPV